MDSTTSTTAAYAAVIARWALGIGGSWLVQHGYVTSEQVPEAIGAAMALIGLGWAGYHHYKADRALKEAKS